MTAAYCIGLGPNSNGIKKTGNARDGRTQLRQHTATPLKAETSARICREWHFQVIGLTFFERGCDHHEFTFWGELQVSRESCFLGRVLGIISLLSQPISRKTHLILRPKQSPRKRLSFPAISTKVHGIQIEESAGFRVCAQTQFPESGLRWRSIGCMIPIACHRANPACFQPKVRGLGKEVSPERNVYFATVIGPERSDNAGSCAYHG